MCQKVMYNSKDDAVLDAAEIYVQMRNSKHMTRHKRLKPYKCRFCEGWHLTSKNGSRKLYKSLTRRSTK